MHMLFVYYLTAGPIRESDSEAGGGRQAFHTNQLVKQGFPSDFTDAVLTFRLRGELEMNSCHSAALYFQIWGTADGVSSGWTLTGQPITVSDEWTDVKVRCVPDEAQWTPMGGRHDRSAPPLPYPATYGIKPLASVLAGPLQDIMLVLYPLDGVAPMGALPPNADPHELRPVRHNVPA